MRIDDRYISGAETASAKRADWAPTGSVGGETANTGHADDAVSLSNLAKLAADALPGEDLQRQSKVARLRAEYQSGGYQVDAQQLARTLAAKILGEAS